jgi:hypothetical protein
MDNRIFSVDSAKAVKAQSYGWLNAIHYLAPAAIAGAGNVCPNASPACLALCLGWFSGQASMVADLDKSSNSVRASRITKTRRFMHDRKAYLRDMVRSIENLQARARKMDMGLCVRLNGSSDIPWESIKAEGGRNLFDLFPNVAFVDYTKSVKRMLRFCAGDMPANYHLTFSRSETNEADCARVLAAGGNIAVVFADGAWKTTFMGRVVVSGDKHDLRHLDPKNVVIGLSPKGNRAKNDALGFVVR